MKNFLNNIAVTLVKHGTLILTFAALFGILYYARIDRFDVVACCILVLSMSVAAYTNIKQQQREFRQTQYQAVEDQPSFDVKEQNAVTMGSILLQLSDQQRNNFLRTYPDLKDFTELNENTEDAAKLYTSLRGCRHHGVIFKAITDEKTGIKYLTFEINDTE